MVDQTTQGRLFRLSIPTLAKLLLLLPVIGFFFSVIWSVLYNFESSTATHCKVPNYLPSISSAIGGYTPQRYVWRICIALHCSPRLMIALAYYNYHTEVNVGPSNYFYQTLAAIASLLHVLENLALVGLTYISSIENHDIHELLFIIFVSCSLVYMLITCTLYHWGHSNNGHIMTVLERRSLRCKVGFFIVNITSLLTAVYLFFRHNTYCEPGIYTWFSLGEYFTVVSNMVFHATVIWDFSHLTMSIGADGVDISERIKSTNSKTTTFGLPTCLLDAKNNMSTSCIWEEMLKFYYIENKAFRKEEFLQRRPKSVQYELSRYEATAENMGNKKQEARIILDQE